MKYFHTTGEIKRKIVRRIKLLQQLDASETVAQNYERMRITLSVKQKTNKLSDANSDPKSITKFAQNNLLIISFSNFAYRKIALNWVAHLKRLDIRNYLIIATDKETESFLSRKDINTVHIEGWTPGKGWGGRFKITRDVLSLGVDIIHSDADSLWIKNPLGFIDDDYDIVASDDGKFPKKIFEKYGMIFCMGWMYYKSCPKVIDVFDAILENKKTGGFDDQAHFNRYMFNQVSREQIKEIGGSILEITTRKLKIKVLGYKIISRNRDNPNAYVRHPNAAKNAQVKENVLKQKKLWLL